MNFGYLIFAKQNESCDYLSLAYLLALSIKLTQPEGYEKIALVTDIKDDIKKLKSPWVFNEVIYKELPEFWDSRSYMYDHSPWEYTVCLDADMIFNKNISHIIDYYSDIYEIGVVKDVMDYRNNAITSNFCRKAFIENNIPSLYSMFTFFKKSKKTKEYFDLVKDITEFPNEFKNLYFARYKPSILGTDEILGVASKILDYPVQLQDDLISILHMKGEIQNWNVPSNKVTNRVGFYVDRNCNVKVGAFKQSDIVHYVEKDLITEEIISLYEQKLWDTV